MRQTHNSRIAALLALAAVPRALFAATQAALTSPTTLDHTLHLLYIAAAGMGFVLLLVAALAYAVYRRNRTAALTPGGTDDSAR